MKIATIIFTYNRSWHTSQVIKALAQNYELPEKLFIFQDGIKKREHEKEWKKVNFLIKQVDFCPVEVIVSKGNKGLAKSVMEGIDYVFQFFDAIIVLEDDCVPSRNFMGFMNQALYKYENVKNIYNITGYGYTDELSNNKYDAYFVGRSSSWGWGTWKDRWDEFSPSHNDLKELMSDEIKSKCLSVWGNDLPQMMMDQLHGKNDSWAVYWSLYIINRQGFCLAPQISLIKNIGMDGTGVHCGITDEYDVKIENETRKKYIFPEKVEFDEEMPFYFMKRFGGYTSYNNNIQKEHVIIYGLGKFFKCNEEFFCNNYYIECFVDRAKEGYYAGKKIIQIDNIYEYTDYQILILVMNIYESERIAKLLHEKYSIEKERIKKINLL